MLRQRYRRLSATHRRDVRVLERKKAQPLVTYGKERPLALTANQFLRRSVFDFPSDDEAEPSAIHTASPEVIREELDEDSPLSDAENNDCNSIESDECERENGPPIKSKVSPSDEKMAIPHRRSHHALKSKHAIILQRPKTPLSSGLQLKACEAGHKNPNFCKRPFDVEIPRQLPVKELTFIKSPIQVHSDKTEADVCGEQHNSAAERFLCSKRFSSSSELQRHRRKQKVSLTSIRKRLRHPKLTYKQINQTERPIFALDALPRSKGDGFEPSEMFLPETPRNRKFRRKSIPFSARFQALQLSSGPLPEVKFHSFDIAGCSKAGSDPQRLAEGRVTSLQGRSAQRRHGLKRKVSFSQRDELIMAQLSSLSLPERPPLSDSEESNYEESEVCKESEKAQTSDEESENPIVTSESEEEFDESITECRNTRDVAKLVIKTHILGNHGEINDGEDDMLLDNDDYEDDLLFNDDEKEDDVLLKDGDDHDDHHLRGFDNKLSSAKTVSQNSYLGAGVIPRNLLRPRRLFEVDDAISDEPEVDIVQVARSDNIPQSFNTQLSEGRSFGQPMRRRSILKNNIHSTSPEMADFESTAANTRRNSFTESRYFENAAKMLQCTENLLHPHIPRRKSLRYSEYQNPPNSRSHDDNEEEEPAAQEAKPFEKRQISILRKHSETLSTSPRIRKAPKDLKTLTRTVSNNHGTLSQSA